MRSYCRIEVSWPMARKLLASMWQRVATRRKCFSWEKETLELVALRRVRTQHPEDAVQHAPAVHRWHTLRLVGQEGSITRYSKSVRSNRLMPSMNQMFGFQGSAMPTPAARLHLAGEEHRRVIRCPKWEEGRGQPDRTK